MCLVCILVGSHAALPWMAANSEALYLYIYVVLLLLGSHLISSPVARELFNQLLYGSMGCWVEAGEVLQVQMQGCKDV